MHDLSTVGLPLSASNASLGAFTTSKFVSKIAGIWSGMWITHRENASVTIHIFTVPHLEARKRS